MTSMFDQFEQASMRTKSTNLNSAEMVVWSSLILNFNLTHIFRVI